MHRCVVLLHTLPDGSSHFDWLIDQPHMPQEHRLLAWRCVHRPDAINAPFQAHQMPDHRAHYLTYEGPLSNNRGQVQRVAQGEVIMLIAEPDHADLTIRWANSTVRYLGNRTPDGPDQWGFTPA